MTTTLCDPRTCVEWPVRGRFDLARSIGFGFGGRLPPGGDRATRCGSPSSSTGTPLQAGVAVTQPAPDLVRFDVVGDVDPERAAAQAARVLSLDEDATGYDRMVDRDPLLRAAYAARPGLRPPLFHSAYEALVWAVLSARRPISQMREVRERLSRAHGRVLDVAGEQMAALPTPEQLLDGARLPGHPGREAAAHARDRRRCARRQARHRGAADARRGRGRVRAARLRGDRAVLRRAGHGARARPHRRAAHDRAPGDRRDGGPARRESLSPADFAEVAEAWRPWRTWACVALRAAA